MHKKRRNRLVHVGQYVAEVQVELIESDSDWCPYLSVEDAYKLDDVRAALQGGDLALAAKYGKVFMMTPVALQRSSGHRKGECDEISRCIPLSGGGDGTGCASELWALYAPLLQMWAHGASSLFAS